MVINREEILQVLRAVQPAVSPNETIEQSNHFVFKDGRVFAYDEKIAVSCVLDTCLACAVPAQELISIIDKIDANEIHIEEKEKQLIITGGRTKVGLSIQKEIRLPLDSFHFEEDDVYLLPIDFSDALSFCNFSASKDRTKPKANNIHVLDNFVESFDNYRVTRYFMEGEVDTELLIPIWASEQLIRYKPIKYFTSRGWLHFINEDNIYFSCRVDMYDYLNLDRFMAVEGYGLSLPKGINKALERVTVFLRNEADDKVNITVQDRILTLKTKGMLGWFEETFDIDSDLVVEFDINPKFLLTILKHSRDIVIGDNLIWFEGLSFIHALSKIIRS